MTVTVEMNETEARQLRALIGRLGWDAYQHIKASEGEIAYFNAAFPEYDDFSAFTSAFFHGLSDHRQIEQPIDVEGRDF